MDDHHKGVIDMASSTKKTRLPHAPRLLVETTDADVKDAVESDSGLCMVAEAIKRQLPEADRRTVTVDLQTIRFSDLTKGLSYWFLTPPIAQDALIRFDQGEPVEPIAFRLRGGNVRRMHRSKRSVEQRAARKAELEAKVERGEASGPEKSALSQMRHTDERRGKNLPTSSGKPRTAIDRGSIVVKGGRAPRGAVLGNARGRLRKYGLRTLKPPRVADEGLGLVYAPRETAPDV